MALPQLRPGSSFLMGALRFPLAGFASSGLGVMLSTFLAPSVALVTAIITTLAVGGLLAGVSPTFPALDARFWPPFASLMRAAAAALSYPRWAGEARAVASVDAHAAQPVKISRSIFTHWS